MMGASERTTLTDGQRLWSTVMEIAKIGAIAETGSCRLSLSDEDRDARNRFASWCRDAGCTVQIDKFGNMFAVRPGRRSDAPCILVGSHLAGLEIVRSLNDHAIETDGPIVVVNWTNEEGVRFKPGLTGSSGFTGSLDEAGITGSDGSEFFRELKRIGYAGTFKPDFAVSAYYELHIEQGPALETAGVPIGVVSSIQGVRWYALQLRGRDAHAGTTPAGARQDSFMAAARISLALRDEAKSIDPDLRFTIGRVEVEPNSQNTVPGLTNLFIDLRHADTRVLDRFERSMTKAVEAAAAIEGTSAKVQRTMSVPPVLFDASLQSRLVAGARALGIQPMLLPSGAMHDASSLASQFPAAMIFVQSRDGISHNPDEWSEQGHVALACEVLARAIISHGSPDSGVRAAAHD